MNAGARVTLIGADPDGMNINDGVGSTHIDNLARAVLEHGADVGIAHDGDADRCLAVDAAGNAIDGDQIMAILALSLQERGHLVSDTLVATVMSNLGLKRAMADAGITVLETGVGDRYVLEKMTEGGFSLGGEQSGHIIFNEYATTGDGILTGLHLVAEMARTGRTLEQLASCMTVFPQVLVNVRGVDRHGLATRACRTPWPLRRPSSGTRAGCCSGRPVPSPSCGSWSRRPPRRMPSASPRSSPTSCARG